MIREIPEITAHEAAAKVNSGDTLIVGGFGMTGYPVHLVHALAESDVSDLVYIGNNVGEPGLGGGCLLYTSPSPRDQRGSRMPSSA